MTGGVTTTGAIHMGITSIYNGPHMLDLSTLQGRLVDIEAGGMRGLRTDMEGFSFVVLELEHSVPVAGAAAGVPQDVYDHFVMCNQTVDAIDEPASGGRPRAP
jgi:hypothetical protein